MNCTPGAFDSRLNLLQVGQSPPRKKRRIAFWSVNESTSHNLETQLEAERSKYIEEHPSLAIVGPQFVCPDNVISSICSNAKFVSVISDMDVFLIRQELKQRFFNVLLAIVKNN